MKIKLIGGPYHGQERDVPPELTDGGGIVLKIPEIPKAKWETDIETAMRPISTDRYRIRRAKPPIPGLFRDPLPTGIYPGDWYGTYVEG